LINPIDYGALNGLGNILLFQGEFDAAEFFVSSAIKCAKKRRRRLLAGEGRYRADSGSVESSKSKVNEV
jgi:hypothetical protein